MHGSSPAAWTAVVMCLTGFTIGGIGLVPDPNWVLFTIGVVIALSAAVVGRVMSAAGLGAEQPDHAEH